jgi:GntR family transcriptional regulator
MLQIATGEPRPINKQIVDGVRRLIASGELTAEGWLDARAGLGLFVATPRQRLSSEERSRRLDDPGQGGR